MLHNKPSKKTYLLLWLIAFAIRAFVFIWFISPGGYYKQPDSVDYHNCATSIAYGIGMYRPDNHEPIFWRTPGYPLFLAPFYRACGFSSFDFDSNKRAHHAALWIQIILSAFIPLIMFALAYAMTQQYAIALLTAFIGTVHPAFVLASTYLLTEGIALIFFYLFLLCIYKGLFYFSTRLPQQSSWLNSPRIFFGIAAIMLALYTWIRPMGECVSIATCLVIVWLSYTNWRKKIGYAFLFLIIFFTALSPWYIRNYRLTGEWFFCPTIGTYFNCFCVPKILRRVLNKPIEECHKMAQQAAGFVSYKKRCALQNTGYYVCPAVCKEVSMPIVYTYPWYFVYDWVTEIIKTTFDLYTSQFVAIVQGTFWYDPIEEFLWEKITACLYAQPMPLSMRIISWIELLYTLFIWIGIIAGIWFFIIRYWFASCEQKLERYRYYVLWISAGIMLASIIVPTGGFGYARLRLPSEPLMIILALSWWYWLIFRKKCDVLQTKCFVSNNNSI